MIRIMLEQGGVLIYPLLLFSVISLAVIIEKTLTFRRVAVRNTVFSAIVNRSYADKDDFNLRLITEGKTNSSLDLIEKVLNRNIGSRKDYEIVIERIRISSLERIDLLDLTGKIAPMIGLTGTVIGLARSFQAVSVSGRAGDPVILAGGIWEAMLTTIAGLLIAIPAITAAHILRHALTKHISRLKHCCDTIYNHRQD